MEIIAISRDEVKIRVKYTNNKITIEEMFANNNFLLTKIDNNYVVLAGKCQNTKRPYLIKYRKDITFDIE